MTRLHHIARLRQPGAAHRLHALVIERHDLPFAWGLRDCCMWAADAAYAATGRDLASDLRGTYWSARQAVRMVAAKGGMQAMLRTRLGYPIPSDQAIDGDICLLVASAQESVPGLGALGVLWRGSILAQADRGLAVRPVSDAAAWYGVSA